MEIIWSIGWAYPPSEKIMIVSFRHLGTVTVHDYLHSGARLRFLWAIKMTGSQAANSTYAFKSGWGISKVLTLSRLQIQTMFSHLERPEKNSAQPLRYLYRLPNVPGQKWILVLFVHLSVLLHLIPRCWPNNCMI